MKPSFLQLQPDDVLTAVERAGFRPTGVFWQLNSYENRVFDIELESEPHEKNSRIIGKFYRPLRWSRQAILEEHEFLQDLVEEGLTAVAPIKLKSGSTLLEHEGIFSSYFFKFKGRMPAELSLSDLKSIGSLLARLHNIGAKKITRHRPVMTTDYYGGWSTLDILESWVAPEVANRYFEAAEKILNQIDHNIDPQTFIRIHGDAHRGNLLKDTSDRFAIIDFDDFCMGPVIQDFWMLLSGDLDQQEFEQNALLEGYLEFRDFPFEQWSWIPWLRGLRLISYSGWIAQRWQDPSFPKLFPEFNSYKYWAEETEALEKISRTI